MVMQVHLKRVGLLHHVFEGVKTIPLTYLDSSAQNVLVSLIVLIGTGVYQLIVSYDWVRH